MQKNCDKNEITNLKYVLFLGQLVKNSTLNLNELKYLGHNSSNTFNFNIAVSQIATYNDPEKPFVH